MDDVELLVQTFYKFSDKHKKEQEQEELEGSMKEESKDEKHKVKSQKNMSDFDKGEISQKSLKDKSFEG